jgi:hypothetical protein
MFINVNILETHILDSFGTLGNLKLSGSILFGIIIVIINLKILVMATGVKPFILVITLLSIMIYWPTEALYAQFADKS